MKQLTNSNEKQCFVLFRFHLACMCVYDEFFGTCIYCAIRMGPLSLIHEQSHWLEIRNYVYFFICWNFVAFYQVMHDTVCYYYYSIFIVMLLLYGITLLYDNGTFQHDLVETDRNLNVTRKKRTLYNITNWFAFALTFWVPIEIFEWLKNSNNTQTFCCIMNFHLVMLFTHLN